MAFILFYGTRGGRRPQVWELQLSGEVELILENGKIAFIKRSSVQTLLWRLMVEYICLYFSVVRILL